MRKKHGTWLRKADLNVKTEAMLCAAQEQAKRYIKQPNHQFVE